MALHVKNHGDLVVAAAISMGHIPVESIVAILTYTTPNPHAPGALRLDIEQIDALADQLDNLAGHFGPLHAYLVVFGTPTQGHQVRTATNGSGTVADVVVTDTHTARCLCGDPRHMAEWAVDFGAHPFHAQAVLTGQTLHTQDDAEQSVTPASAGTACSRRPWSRPTWTPPPPGIGPGSPTRKTRSWPQ